MALTNEEEQELNALLQKIDNYDQMNKVSQWLTTLGDSLTNRPELKSTPTKGERERAKQLQKEQIEKPEMDAKAQEMAEQASDRAAAFEKARQKQDDGRLSMQGDEALGKAKAKAAQRLTAKEDSLSPKIPSRQKPETEEQGNSAATDYSWAKEMADTAKKNAIKPSIQSVFSSGGGGDESNFETQSNVAEEGSKENPVLASTLTVEKQAQLPEGTYIKDSKGRVRKLEQNEIDWARSKSKLQKSKPSTQDNNPYAMNIEDAKREEGRGGVTDVPMTEKAYESPEDKAAKEAEERKQFEKSEGILYYTDKNGVEKPVTDHPMKNLSMNQIAYLFAAAKKEGDEEKQKALQKYIYEDPARRAAAIEWQKNHSKK